MKHDVRCPSCGTTFPVPERAAEVVELRPRPAPVGDDNVMTCPKCDDRQPAAAACRSCGLLATRMADFARGQGVTAPDDVAAAWDRVTAAWGDVDVHDRFVRAVAAAMAYPWAAQRYREALRLRPDDRLAAEQLARLARMAEATLFATGARKPAEVAKPYRGAIALLAVMLVLIIVGVGAAVLGSSLKEEAPRPRPGKAAPRPAIGPKTSR